MPVFQKALSYSSSVCRRAFGDRGLAVNPNHRPYADAMARRARVSCEDFEHSSLARMPVTARDLSKLVDTIEVEIIPRLMLVHGVGSADAAAQQAAGQATVTLHDAAELARIAMNHDVSVVASFVEVMRARGVPLEAVFLDLLAPAARLLGELWNADLCSFADVTIGLWRLQEVLYELTSPVRVAESEGAGRRILLLPCPGDQHTFGLVMVAEFFRRAGWEVTNCTCATAADLARAVRREEFAIVGLSASCEDRLDGLASSIKSVRGASRNRSVAVLVGGSPFVAHPDWSDTVGADATASDARKATLLARSLLDKRSAIR